MSCRGPPGIRCARLQHRVHRLLEIGDDVVGVLDAAAQTHQVDADPGLLQLLLGELAVRGAGRIQRAAAGIGHMRGDRDHLEVVEQRGDLVAAAGHAEGDHAAGAVRHVLLGGLVVLVAGQAGELHPADARIVIEELGHLLRVLAVALHAHGQRFQMHAHDPGVHRRRGGAEVAHQLRGGLGDECALAEVLRVGHAVVGVVRRGQAGELVRVGHPIEVAGVHDRAADAGAVAIHVLGGRMGHDVHAVLERTAVDRRRERVVHDDRHAVVMRGGDELVEVEHDQRRIRDRFGEHGLGIRLERGVQLLRRAVGAHERALDAHLAHRHVDQIERAAVDR